MRKTTIFILLAVLCLTLAGCQNTDPAPEAGPASQNQPETSAQDVSQPDPAPEPEEAPTPEAEPEEPQDVQPVEPSLPEPTGSEDDSSDSFVGTWRNDGPGSMSNGRCYMEITCEDGVNYDIDIWWGSSASATSHWQYAGTYDEAQSGIAYTGTRYYEVTQADGTVEQTVDLENAEGLLRLEDGVLYWEDTVDYVSDEMKFNKES